MLTKEQEELLNNINKEDLHIVQGQSAPELVKNINELIQAKLVEADSLNGSVVGDKQSPTHYTIYITEAGKNYLKK